jgi:hypothetical protein
MSIIDGLVGAWCPSLGPSGYTLLDRSGRGRHGTLTNMDAASDWVIAPGGWALDFDGVNDNVPTGIEGTKFIPPGQPFSVSLWVYLSGAQPSSAGGYLISDFTSAGYDCSFSIRVLTDNRIDAFTNAQAHDLIRGGSITTDEWFHVAYVSRSAANKELFVDGVSVGTSTVSVTRATAGNLTFGQPGDFTAANFRLNGRLADLGVWNRALASPEVGALYRAGQGGLGRLLTQRKRRRVYGIAATAAKPYLFLNRGQVIGGGML